MNSGRVRSQLYLVIPISILCGEALPAESERGVESDQPPSVTQAGRRDSAQAPVTLEVAEQSSNDLRGDRLPRLRGFGTHGPGFQTQMTPVSRSVRWREMESVSLTTALPGFPVALPYTLAGIPFARLDQSNTFQSSPLGKEVPQVLGPIGLADLTNGILTVFKSNPLDLVASGYDSAGRREIRYRWQADPGKGGSMRLSRDGKTDLLIDANGIVHSKGADVETLHAKSIFATSIGDPDDRLDILWADTIEVLNERVGFLDAFRIDAESIGVINETIFGRLNAAFIDSGGIVAGDVTVNGRLDCLGCISEPALNFFVFTEAQGDDRYARLHAPNAFTEPQTILGELGVTNDSPSDPAGQFENIDSDGAILVGRSGGTEVLRLDGTGLRVVSDTTPFHMGTITGESSLGETAGVLGTSSSADGVGVAGLCLGAGCEMGVVGEGEIGVNGHTNIDSGVGVLGEVAVGVVGGVGVLGEAHGDLSTGVDARANGYGSIGLSVEGPSQPGGYAAVFNGEVVINGTFTHNAVAQFVQPHPTDASKELVHLNLETSESLVMIRGAAHLTAGVAEIEMPEHFRVVAAEDGLQVVVTPVGAWAPLYVEGVSPERLVIRSADPRSEDVRFNYVVTAVRTGFEKHEAIQENHSFRPIGRDSAEEFAARYAGEDSHSKAIRQMLISNGILNPDGSVNEMIAETLGFQFGPGRRLDQDRSFGRRRDADALTTGAGRGQAGPK